MKDLDIKKIWKEDRGDAPEQFNPGLIDKIIDKGSVSIISKFINTLRWEMWINFSILTVIALYLAIGGKWWVASFLLFVDVGYFVYYRKLIKRLGEKTIDSSVVDYLKTTYILINKFIGHYKTANVILALPLFMSGMYFADPDIFSQKYFSDGWFIVLVSAGFAVAILFLYLFLYFVYGKKAVQIRKLIEEMSQNENPT